MHGDNDMSWTEQRATVGVTWGGSDWGIHASSDVNYRHNAGGVVNAAVYEAYASTDLMGYANLTVGRQALDYGSGAIISSNQFGSADRTTYDGMTFGLNLDIADIDLGYTNQNDGGDVDVVNSSSRMMLNVGKAEGDWSANLLYVKGSSTTAGTDDEDATAMGLDLSYAMMGGDLSLDVSYNTADDGTEAGDMDMTSLGATYSVNESMSITANQTSYGENGFDVGSASMGGYAASGSLGYLGADNQDRNVGITYTMGDFSLGATMHAITNEGEDAAGSTTNADYERSVTDISLGYTMSDNANLSIKMVTDQENDDDEVKYMWVTLNIGL
jgi:hypothetical protein